MRRLTTIGLLLGAALLACAVPTALPQSPPTVLSTQLISALGDTAEFAVSIRRARAPVDTAPRRAVGLPFGPVGLWKGSNALTGPFTASLDWTDKATLIPRIAAARAAGKRLVLMLTDLDHSASKLDTPLKTGGKFDLAKWKAVMDGYRDPSIQAAVAQAVADRTVIGNSVVDEPMHASWGGSFTKAIVDTLCAYQKGIFPTLPAGVATAHWWKEGVGPQPRQQPQESFRVCDFMITQYDWWQPPYGNKTGAGQGDIAGWKAAALASGTRQGMAVMFSLNILDGGEISDTSCPTPRTGGHGTYSGGCQMTADQVRSYGLALGPSGCGLTLWRYDPAFVSRPDNAQALGDLAGVLATTPSRPCRRS